VRGVPGSASTTSRVNQTKELRRAPLVTAAPEGLVSEQAFPDRQGCAAEITMRVATRRGSRVCPWRKTEGLRRPVAVTETVTHAARQRATGRDLPPRSPEAMRPQCIEKAGGSGDRRRELSIQRSRVQVPSSPPLRSPQNCHRERSTASPPRADRLSSALRQSFGAFHRRQRSGVRPASRSQGHRRRRAIGLVVHDARRLDDAVAGAERVLALPLVDELHPALGP
jgi:hypothetical protein